MDDEYLKRIEILRGHVVDLVEESLELPEPTSVLDLDSRKGSPERIRKHIDQSCRYHWKHFERVTLLKLAYLLDGFLVAVETENPMLVHSAARSMLELSALSHEVRMRLLETKRSIDGPNWQQMGVAFFGVLVRARFGTNSPESRRVQLEAGLSKKKSEPLNVTSCIRGLASEPDCADAVDRYDELSDFVHQNLGAGLSVQHGYRTGNTFQSGATTIGLPSEVPIAIYNYPLGPPFLDLVDHASRGFFRDATDCIRWLDEAPQSPFDDQ